MKSEKFSKIAMKVGVTVVVSCLLYTAFSLSVIFGFFVFGMISLFLGMMTDPDFK